MRYLAQFLIPLIIVLVVVYLLARKRTRTNSITQTGAEPDSSDTGGFLAILFIGACVAIASVWAVQEFWT